MLIFLALFLSIYGTLHLYVLVKVRRALYIEGFGYFLLFLVLTFLLLAPILARLLEAQANIIPALIITWTGYLWMGLLFLFLCLSIPLDLYHMALAAMQHLLDADLTHLMLSRRQSLTLALTAAISIMVYGVFESRQIQIESVVLQSSKIPQAAKPLRIVQISDMHLGLMLYPGRLARIITTIGSARPDILVSTGDLVDGRIANPDTTAQALSAIEAPLGKFAVTGNHEYYAGVDTALNFTRQAGFTILRGSAADVNGIVTIAGVDDPTGGRNTYTNEHELMTGLPTGRYTVLLKHRPEVDPASEKRIDLQLSGHTHKGQIFPFTYVIELRYGFIAGLRRFAEGAHLYVSRGTGTWGPPIRVLARPEITVIELRPATP